MDRRNGLLERFLPQHQQFPQAGFRAAQSFVFIEGAWAVRGGGGENTPRVFRNSIIN